ncbi:MAG: cyclic nucleotide-binding domain-containing protein [Fibrobacteria bacterium]|nr:cyclic nucleotide-binding domain-containing protein [Fibrobacteria bacterium]
MEQTLSTIDKVIFLQDVDIFEYTATEDLAHIAAIAEEKDYAKNQIVFKEGDVSNAMYLVVSGEIEILKDGLKIMKLEEKNAFGTWALFDDEEVRMVSARCSIHSRALRIDREDFYDLLADNVRITQGILKQLARRLRGLIKKVSTSGQS